MVESSRTTPIIMLDPECDELERGRKADQKSAGTERIVAAILQCSTRQRT